MIEGELSFSEHDVRMAEKIAELSGIMKNVDMKLDDYVRFNDREHKAIFGKLDCIENKVSYHDRIISYAAGIFGLIVVVWTVMSEWVKRKLGI